MELRGRHTLVVGLGLSGRAAARLLLREGARVAATDSRTAEELKSALNGLSGSGVEFHLGGHSPELFTSPELIVLSPGVPSDLPEIEAARKAGVEVIGELALAASLTELPTVAVTGTNGKSTTTALIAHLLEASGKKVFLGGNIGRPLSELILDEPEAEIAVVEVSSYQLENLPFFKPRVAVLTNLSPDHLDRHGTFENYARTKARIWADLDERDFVITNSQDKATTSLVRACRARRTIFGPSPAESPGYFPAGPTRASLTDPDGRSVEVDTSGFSLPGPHNRENLLAALGAAWLMGAEPRAMAESLSSFKALPHRLEWVREIGGVDYYNDSKATNVVSAAKAVLGFDRPVILIGGGLDKEAGYAELVEAGQGRIRTALLIGAAAGLMAAELKDICEIEMSGDLETAVSRAAELARPGDVVLLAPACASFDQFENYGRRGDLFRQLVESL